MIITKSTPFTNEEIDTLNKIAIESLSMDLMRVALGLHRGSLKMAERFSEEALLRISEINKSNVKPNFAKILNKISDALKNTNIDEKAEEALMYSVICKNYARKFLVNCSTKLND